LWPLQERLGDCRGAICPRVRRLLVGMHSQALETKYSWLRRRMFLCMIDGRVGFVVVDRSIVLVVMVNAFIVRKLVGNRCRPNRSRQAALHGETIQGQTQQKEDVDDSTQENSQIGFARL
jgi:uncharacterized membrane protein